MRHLLRLCAAALFLLLLSACARTLPDMSNPPEPAPSPMTALTHIIDPDSEVRGVWIASVWNLDYPSRADLPADALKAEADALLDLCGECGLNTIFFQVRPAADALYKSDLFPVSSALSSSGELVFDPLDYFLTEGRQRNIRVYAWVNPLRVTLLSTELSSLPENHPARLHPDWTVAYADGRLYFDAGIPEVRQFVADGLREIVTRYDVDGVVFDDYFYPYPTDGADFGDDASWQKYGGDFSSRADWRRNNVNELVKLCHDTVRFVDPECVFGVSPYGVWQNDDGKNGGSGTNSFEAYHSLYCDATAWIEGGYIDFLSPQIYWDFDSNQAPFDTLVRWWNTRLDGTDVKLYVSHAAYKYDEADWPDPAGELVEQVTFARSERFYYGRIFYGCDELKRNAKGAADDVKAVTAPEIIYSKTQSNGLGVTVTAPAEGTVLDSPVTYLLGMSDPYYGLTVNGEKVGRTKSGYFSLRTALENGENTFVFEQNGKKYTYTLYYGSKTGAVEETDLEETPADDPDPEDTEEEEELTILEDFRVSFTYPVNEVATDEENLWVSCVAPVDCDVTAMLDGEETPLVPLADPKTRTAENGYVYISYGKNLTLPEAKRGEVHDCGRVLFRAVSGDGEEAEAEGIRVRRMGEESAIRVEVLEDYTQLKLSPTSSVYNDYTVQSAGMRADASAVRDGRVLLRMGGYLAAEDVRETGEGRISSSVIVSAEAEDVGRTTELRFYTSGRPPYNGAVVDGAFVLTFYDVRSAVAAEPKIGENPLFSSCRLERDGEQARYIFPLKDPMNFYGFDLEYRDGVTAVSLRNPIRIDPEAERPLEGITVVLDAGHGGSDPGAAGPRQNEDGSSETEKDLNLALTLAAAEKLRALGAEVELLRDGDGTLDLMTRVAMLEELEPDLCLSLHQNSMGYASDVTRIRGTLGLWCEAAGRLLADSAGPEIAASLGRNYRGTEWQALAMCRNPKFPAALIEVGFMTNVEEYETMTSARGLEAGAQGVVRGVLRYFARMADFAG